MARYNWITVHIQLHLIEMIYLHKNSDPAGLSIVGVHWQNRRCDYLNTSTQATLTVNNTTQQNHSQKQVCL